MEPGGTPEGAQRGSVLVGTFFMVAEVVCAGGNRAEGRAGIVCGSCGG